MINQTKVQNISNFAGQEAVVDNSFHNKLESNLINNSKNKEPLSNDGQSNRRILFDESAAVII